MVFMIFFLEMVFISFIISEINCPSTKTPSGQEPTNTLAKMLSPKYLSSFGDVSSKIYIRQQIFKKVFFHNIFIMQN